MELQDFRFFSKDGRLLNFQFNESRNIFEGKLFFDRNSNDTYKTQALYIFENVDSVTDKDVVTLERFQLFNDEGYSIVSGGKTGSITLIEPVNDLSTFKSKWVHGTDFHHTFQIGTIVKFVGLSGEFAETSGGKILTYTVVETKKDAVMLITNNTNDTFSAPGSYSGATLVSINAIGWLRSSNTWNETSPQSLLYAGKKLTLFNSKYNDGVYTIKELANTRTKTYYKTAKTQWTSPIANSKLAVDVTFFTDRILVYDGEVTFATDNTVTFTNGVPNTIAVDSVIVSESGLTANQQDLTVVSIDKANKKISVTASGSLANQTITTRIFFTTNELNLRRDVVVYNGSANPAMTMAAFAEENSILFELNDLELYYDIDNDQLVISPLYNHNYISVSVSKIEGSTETTFTTSTSTNTIDLLSLIETVNKEKVSANSVLYKREIVFTSIDSNDLNIIINDKKFSVQSSGNLVDALTDWKTAYITNDDYLLTHGINASVVNSLGGSSNPDRIILESAYPNVPIFTNVSVGSQTDYSVRYAEVTINSLNSILTINIAGKDYSENFDTDIATTIGNWNSSHIQTLKENGIIILSTSTTIKISTLDAEYNPSITVNTGVQEKPGLNSYSIDFIRGLAAYTVLSGNEITSSNINFLKKSYSTGQTITLTGSTYDLQNRQYNILRVASDRLGLSYQGAFWGETGTMTVKTSPTIRYPRRGLSDENVSKLIFSWEDTIIDDIFFYDFSGTQLLDQTNPNLTYVGDKPLIGENGTNKVLLNKNPNTNPDLNSDPSAQQTVFDSLSFNMEFIDSSTDISSEPVPIQVFMGMRSDTEGVSNATLFVYMKDNKESLVPTETVPNSTPNDLVVFHSDGTVEISSASLGIDFITFGIKPGQWISFNGVDETNRAVLQNNGRVFKVLTVTPYTLTVDMPLLPMIEETSVKTVVVLSPPFFDVNGDPNTDDIAIPVTIKVEPQPVAEIQVYGQTEIEDDRFRIALHNLKGDILQVQDYYIFREYDINENGIDWVYINRKRKELIQIYDNIFDNVDSYYAVINAINFFGYKDLQFFEHFRNINIDSPLFGQLFDAELIGIFDPTVKGWKSGNSMEAMLPNSNYVKTNLFGLSYQITDEEGNFVWAISKEEAQVKLFGLKRWLQNHVMELGTKLLDIQGKVFSNKPNYIKHESYYTKKIVTENTISPITISASGYLHPISSLSNNYNIKFQFASNAIPEYFNLHITTFAMDDWITTKPYVIGDIVFHNGKVYECLIGNTNIEPASQFDINHWQETTDWTMNAVQQIEEQRFDLSDYVVTVNKLLDPHIRIEVTQFNDYGSAWSNTKTYSLNYGAWV